MKTKYLLPVLVSGVIALAIATTNSAMSAQTPAAGKDATTLSNDLFKTIVDEKSGQVATVNAARDTITLRDDRGKTYWTTNVVEALKSVQISGERKIHGLQLLKGDLVASVSRGSARIDKKTGAVVWLGSD